MALDPEDDDFAEMAEIAEEQIHKHIGHGHRFANHTFAAAAHQRTTHAQEQRRALFSPRASSPSPHLGERIGTWLKNITVPKRNPSSISKQSSFLFSQSSSPASSPLYPSVPASPSPSPKSSSSPSPAAASRPNARIGIVGFDELLPEGIPEGSAILLSGGPGTGKTTFGLCSLGWACKAGQRCLYLSFEEDVERLRTHMNEFGFDVDTFEKEGLLIIKKMDSFDLSRSAEALLAKASGELLIDLEEIEGIIHPGFSPDRIVIDSLSAVAAAFWGRPESYRVYLEQLFSLFKRQHALSFFISEIEQSTKKYSRSGIEEFLADAVFVFYNLRHKTVRVSACEIIKVRGVAHSKKIVPFKMTRGKGIVVYPQEDILATV